MNKLFKILCALALMCGLAVVSTSAHGAFQVTFSATSSANQTVTDNNVPSGDTNPALGLIQATVSIGPAGSQFTDAFTGSSKPFIPNTPTDGGTDQSHVVVDAKNLTGSTEVLHVTMTDTGFHLVFGTPPDVFLESVFSGNVSNVAGHPSSGYSITFQSWVDASNTAFGKPAGATTGLQGPFTTSASLLAGSDLAKFVGPMSNPFSITSEMTITLKAGGAIRLSADGSTTVSTPEPSTLVALLTGIPLLGICGWRRRRQTSGLVVA